MSVYLRGQVTPYVILFVERDGSTYLTSLLASHPDIEAVYERFAVLRNKGVGAEEQLAWARKFLAPPVIGRAKAIGFKTKLVDALNITGFASLLIDFRCRIIEMHRRNHVKAVVSRINARRLHETTGNWNLYEEEDRMPPLEVDPAEFATFMEERDRSEQELLMFTEDLQLPTQRIVYEELLVDRNGTLNRVFEFLRVKPWEVQSRTLKNTSDDLRQAVVNFEELRSQYAGTRYAPMFDEVLVPDAV